MDTEWCCPGASFSLIVLPILQASPPNFGLISRPEMGTMSFWAHFPAGNGDRDPERLSEAEDKWDRAKALVKSGDVRTSQSFESSFYKAAARERSINLRHVYTIRERSINLRHVLGHPLNIQYGA